jgi:hypothetical protein
MCIMQYEMNILRKLCSIQQTLGRIHKSIISLFSFKRTPWGFLEINFKGLEIFFRDLCTICYTSGPIICMQKFRSSPQEKSFYCAK